MKEQVFAVSIKGGLYTMSGIKDGICGQVFDYPNGCDCKSCDDCDKIKIEEAKPTAEEFVEWCKNVKRIDVTEYLKLFNERAK